MIGTQVGAYRVLQQIGEGGMGSVWLVEHAMLGRRAAIKILHPAFTARPDIVTRFFNEARAATAISDPGIVQIFDFGHHVDGSAYIVMELLDGETLDKRIRTRGVLPISDALRIMRQVASSLGAAHARGIIHRDLKPENIFLVRDGEVASGERAKILDFGIAKLTGDASIKTQTSAMMGTPMYMSPEQCRGAGGVDHRSDVYALGCVLFATLTGRPPFHAEGVGDIIAMHLLEPAPAPSQFAHGIPLEIDQLVLRCLQKDPAARFASATDLASALDELRVLTSHEGVPTPRVSTPGVVVASNTTLSKASGSRDLSSMTTSPRSRAGLVLGGIVAVGAIVAAIAVVATRGGDEPTPVASASAPAQPPSLAGPASTPASPPPVPDVTVESPANVQMRAALKAFVAWAPAHSGAPCPDAAALGLSSPLAITCTDQPANQIVGVVVAGADSVLGTADDIASWDTRNLAAIVHGPRWRTTVAAVKTKPTMPAKQANKTNGKTTSPAASTPTTTQPATPTPTKPLLDSNGIPIVR